MAVRGVGVPDQASGAGVADVRTRERTVDGGTYAEQYVIPINERVADNKGAITSFRIPARAVASNGTQPIFTLENKTGSTALVAARQVSVVAESVAAKAVIAPIVRCFRSSTSPTNGTVLSKERLDTADTANASVEVRGDASADGTNSASALAVTISGTGLWQRYAPRFHTLVGQAAWQPLEMVPPLNDYPMILRAGQNLVIAIVNNSGGAWTAADWHFMVSAAWEEFTLP